MLRFDPGGAGGRVTCTTHLQPELNLAREGHVRGYSDIIQGEETAGDMFPPSLQFNHRRLFYILLLLCVPTDMFHPATCHRQNRNEKALGFGFSLTQPGIMAGTRWPHPLPDVIWEYTDAHL